jgi:hypothetical protein
LLWQTITQGVLREAGNRSVEQLAQEESEMLLVFQSNKYFGSVLGKSTNLKVRVYWGEATEFAIELRKHWESASQ